MKKKITLGTKEWADSNVNCYYGCANNCRYCYAKKMAIRFKRKTEDTWKIMEPNLKNINQSYRKRKGRIMFPTSHDITEVTLNNCNIVIKKLLTSRNSLLITTKPNLVCINSICKYFIDFKELIQFRFTITSMNNDILRFWEPNAPNFEERLNSLRIAYKSGYKTSISIEPLLEKDPFPLIEVLIPYVTESIWIGKMNYMKNIEVNSYEKKYYELIKDVNSTENLKLILEKLKRYNSTIIKIKDSIYNFLSK